MQKLTHTDQKGKAAMVDISAKLDQKRVACAEGYIRLQPETIELVRDNSIKKGDVQTIAEIAGIQASKLTANIIPLCHPIALSSIRVKTEINDDGIRVEATAICTGKTGVEMEALQAVSASLLTVYDMCKAVDARMELYGIRLLSKTKEDIR